MTDKHTSTLALTCAYIVSLLNKNRKIDLDLVRFVLSNCMM